MKFFDFLKKKETVSDMSIAEKTEAERVQIALLGQTCGKTGSNGYTVFTTTRESSFNSNMDHYVDLIKNEKVLRPFLSRTINNITKGALKEGYYFVGEGETEMDDQKLLQVEEKFEDIMYNSSYGPRNFIREVLSNLVNYSNVFVKPIREGNKTKQELARVLILPNKGWSVKERAGCKPITWTFKSKDGKIKEYNYKDVWHMTFNKETDEVFGAPVWLPVIPSLRKYDTLIEESMISYQDQGLTKVIYSVLGNGKANFVDPVTFGEIKEILNNSGNSDVVIKGNLDIKEIKREYKSPEKLISDILKQVVAGLHTSESQLGISGAGRQDAETQSDNTNLIVEDFQEVLEDWISFFVVREICIDLFGDYSSKNRVKFKFKKTFTDQERKEKHDLMMFQGNAIDHDELRNRTGRGKKKFNTAKSWLEISKVAEIEKTAEASKNKVENASNPKNQHKPNGTGTTRKTKKDEGGL